MINKIKYLLAASSFLFLGTLTSLSATSGLLSSFQSGNRWIDTALTVVSGGNPAKLALYNMGSSFGLGSSFVEQLVKQGFTFTDIYYLGFLHKLTGKSVGDLVKEKNQGLGWGVIAQRLGIHPGEFNKARIALKKDYKVNSKVLPPGLSKKDKKENQGKGKGLGKGHVKKEKPEKAKGKKK